MPTIPVKVIAARAVKPTTMGPATLTGSIHNNTFHTPLPNGMTLEVDLDEGCRGTFHAVLRIAVDPRSTTLEILGPKEGAMTTPTPAAAVNEATEIHYTVIDRDNGERYSTTSSTSRDRTERERHRLALLDGKIVCLGIGRINPDGSIDDVTEVTEVTEVSQPLERYLPMGHRVPPDGVRFDVPPENQGQREEVAYGGFEGSPHVNGAPFKRVRTAEEAIAGASGRYFQLASVGGPGTR